jgi:hypothetical protein
VDYNSKKKEKGAPALTPSFGSKSVQAIVTLPICTDLSTERKGGRSRQGLALGIDINDANLHRSMIL